MTKSSLMIELTLAGVICLCLPLYSIARYSAPEGKSRGFGPTQDVTAAEAQAEANDSASTPAQRGTSISKQPIRFEFEQADWQDVIPWFAEQAGFSLQPITDWPEGTFHLVDKSEYSVIEALDQLNHALRLRAPPYTLVRNRNMLVLVRADQQNYPSELIETVSVGELDKRGKYETMRCVFEFGELDCMDFDQQLQQLVTDVNRSAYAVFTGANQIHVRETGATLRVIRDIILKAQQRQNAKDSTLVVYRLKYLDPDSFLFVARGLLGIEEDQNQRKDGSLSISAEPLSDRLFVKGTQSGLAQFQQVAKLLDVAPEDVEEGQPLDRPYFRSYPVTSDPKLAFDALQTFLAEREGVRMQQDEITGAIAVLGRKADHQIVAETLAMIEGSNGQQFAIIQLEYAEPTNVILTLRSLWGQTGELEPQGPVLLGNALQRTVIVRGTPTEVTQVKSMIAQLDAAATRMQDGPRTRTRVIPMDDAKRDEVMGLLEDYWPSTGRTNRLQLNLIMPEDRPKLERHLRRIPKNDKETTDVPLDFGANEGGSGFQSLPTRRMSTAKIQSLVLAQLLTIGQPVALLAAPEQLGTQSSASSGLSQQSTSPRNGSSRVIDPDYRPPEKVKTVPGADIEVRATTGGIVITSEDLDALDDLEDLIREQMGLKSDVQAPTFFFLKHRYAEEIAGFLRGYFGLASSDSGEGGVGGMMGGMLNNMMGGGTSDLLGGLLGGTDSFGELSMLEGDVKFGTDSEFNTVYVTGATGTDLNRINEIIEILDQPNAPQDPELLGQFRTIPIVHRDPEEVKQIIETQLSDLIQTGVQNEGGNNQQGNQQAEQMMKLVQQVAGGGESGESSASTTERPKARLGVDTKTSQLLVTGPEFIYKEVLKMVLELDKPQLSVPPTYVVIPNGGKNSELLKRNLKAIFGSKIEITDDEDEDSGLTDSSSNESSKSDNNAQRNANNNLQAQQEQMRRQFFRELSRQRQGGGQGGGRGSPRGGGRR